MNAKTRDDGTAVWWFVAAAFTFTSITLFFTEMPPWFQLIVMAIGAVLLVNGVLVYRRERKPRTPRS